MEQHICESRGFALTMSDVQNGYGGFALHTMEQIGERFARFVIECGKWFIQK